MAGIKRREPGEVHWLLTSLAAGGASYEAARQRLLVAIDDAGGQASGVAKRLVPPYPHPAIYRVLDAYGLLGELQAAKIRFRDAKAAPRDPNAPPGRAGYWYLRALREESPVEKERAKKAVREALMTSGGDVRAAAEALGMTSATLYRLLKRAGLSWFIHAVRAERIKREQDQKK